MQSALPFYNHTVYTARCTICPLYPSLCLLSYCHFSDRTHFSALCLLYFPLSPFVSFVVVAMSTNPSYRSSSVRDGAPSRPSSIISMLMPMMLGSMQGKGNRIKMIRYTLLFLILTFARATLEDTSVILWKLVVSSLMKRIQKTFIGKAMFLEQDRAYHWINLFLNTHVRIQNTSRTVMVTSAKPSILLQPVVDLYSSNKTTTLLWQRVSSFLAFISKSKSNKIKAEQVTTKPNVYFSPLEDGSSSFIFEGTRFWAQSKQQMTQGKVTNYVEVTFASTSDAPLCRLLDYVHENYRKQTTTGIAVIQMSNDGQWEKPKVMSKRLINSIHLKQKDSILEDAKQYFSEKHRKTYKDKSVPLRRGYLFYGPPGTGKTTMCHVLASELNVPLYVLKLNSKNQDDATLAKRMEQIPDRSIILIEDVDAAFIQRKEGGQGSNVSFSGLLNSIDGIGAAEGRLLCFTTNHVESLDTALTRESRVDMKIAFTNATQEQAKELYLRLYSGSRGHCEPELMKQADAFASLIPSGQYRLSALQCLLLQYQSDPKGAIEGVALWIKEKEGH